MEEDVDGDLADIENLNYDDLDSVSKLQKTQRYSEIMQVWFVHECTFCYQLWITFALYEAHCFIILLPFAASSF